MRFYLIQRGKFNKDGIGLTGKNGVVDLSYMGSFEFEFGAIPKSFRRIMYYFNNYIYLPTGIFTRKGDELILFSNYESSNEILEALKFFIYNPYQLKEYSELEKVPNFKADGGNCTRLRTNFWWCIDYNNDWMAFLNSNRKLFEKGINYDYNNWWLVQSKEERENEYVKSLKR